MTETDDRRLDAELAVALGWKDVKVTERMCYGKPPRDYRYGDMRDYEDVPAYSGTWKGMGLLVEAMRGKGFDYSIRARTGEQPLASFLGMTGSGHVSADTASRACAKAAYRALMGKEWKEGEDCE